MKVAEIVFPITKLHVTSPSHVANDPLLTLLVRYFLTLLIFLPYLLIFVDAESVNRQPVPVASYFLNGENVYLID